MSPDAIKLTIDGVEVEVPAGTLLWEAAHKVHIDVPIFCYHSKLGPVGVCRMCMVEVEGMPKLTTACTTAATNGMVVHTRSPEVEKAQRGVLEFLLVNHPLDCPICDRAGECPLQDQTFQYGPGVSRFIERKRHYLKPIHLGSTIDLDRERCILCWRCVRFTSEVVEDDQLILVDRGSETSIGTYEGTDYESNYSGNVIELCPVGALTSRKQRFTFRPWELKQHSSICPHCALGCNIQIDVRDAQEVTRFRSRTNDSVDDGWLCDRGRFGYDFIGSPDRLKTPLIRRGGTLEPVSWQTAYRFVAENLQRVAAEHGPDAIAGVVSPSLPNEDLFAFGRFMKDVVGTSTLDYWPRPELPASPHIVETLRTLDAHLVPVEALDRASVIAIAGTDPGQKQPVMELRIRKAVNKRGTALVEIGHEDISLTPMASALIRCEGDALAGLYRALAMPGETSPEWSQFASGRALLDQSGSIVILYEEAADSVPFDQRADTLAALAALVESLAQKGEVGVIPMLESANEMAARDFGLAAGSDDGEAVKASLVRGLTDGNFVAALLAGVDPIKELKAHGRPIPRLDFCVVTALSRNDTTEIADVVLPSAAFAERVGTFTNTARRVQVFSAAVPAPGIARPDWQILVELSQRWDNPLSYSSPEAILADIGASIASYGDVLPRSYADMEASGVPITSGSGMAAQ